MKEPNRPKGWDTQAPQVWVLEDDMGRHEHRLVGTSDISWLHSTYHGCYFTREEIIVGRFALLMQIETWEDVGYKLTYVEQPKPTATP
jgi:hypothetical protein